MERQLPAQFTDWQCWVEKWSSSEGDQRLRARLNSTPEEREDFFTQCFPRLQEALAYLDERPMGQWSASDHVLMDILLNLAHIALAVETQGDAEPEHARFAKYMTYTRTPQVAAQ